MMLEGVLPVLKPVDYTSHDVVAKVRRFTGIRRIGHTGTLDPKVTGVLPLCIGRATRIVEYLQELPKTYEADLLVGIATDTEDMTGEVVRRADRVDLTEAQATAAIRSFVGTIEQVPPMYSAVKVGGKRLYELARQGQEVERKPRTVDIYSIDILKLELDREFPLIRFRVVCSKGTYIRTLCADIGKALGYPAAMASLVRTASGAIALAQCLTLDEVERLAASGELAAKLLPADQAVRHLPSVVLDAAEAARALHGQTVPMPQQAASDARAAAGAGVADGSPPVWRVYGPAGAFVGLFAADAERGRLAPVKVWGESASED